SRLAGTIRQYSKNAIPQLTRITANSGEDLYFRCPYQAKVMKMLEAVSSRIGSRRSKGGIGAIRRGGTGQKDHRSSRRLYSATGTFHKAEDPFEETNMRAGQETGGLVLIVEDNRNISEMVGEYLEGQIGRAHV